MFPPPPQGCKFLTVSSNLISGCHGHSGSANVSGGIGPGQEQAVKEDSRRSGSGGGRVRGMRGVVVLIQQYKADPSEVQVLREAGWVSGPRRDAVGAGGGWDV